VSLPQATRYISVATAVGIMFSLAVAAVLSLAVALVAQTQPTDAAQVLAAAREALGGDKNLSAVKTFVANGRTRQVRGNNLVPIEFEMNCELPDRFVRKDEFPAQDTDPTTLGFNGNELIQFPLSPPGQRLVGAKQDFARLTLGMFAASFPSYPLTFRYAAQGEAPEGVADIIDVSGPANFSAKLIVQRATHLPVMLMWERPAPNAPAKPVENRLYYGDYRDVNGVKWPFRLRRAVAGDTVEETTFDRFRINAKIDAKKFEVAK
jgi:hypothetical protein